jgi:hypothetical protein
VLQLILKIVAGQDVQVPFSSINAGNALRGRAASNAPA